jgi:hypothetical protein
MKNGILAIATLLLSFLHAQGQTTIDTTATCWPNCNGSIMISTSAGTPPYNYSIDGGNTFSSNNFFGGLCLDTFNIVITDASSSVIYTGSANTTPQGCQQLASSPLTFNYNVVNSDSFGLIGITHCTGAVNFTVSGGVPPYLLAMQNASTGATTPYQSSTYFDSLCTGSYYLLIQDAVGSQFCYCYFPTTIFIPKACPPPGNASVTGYDCTTNSVQLYAFSMDMMAMYNWSSISLTFGSPYSSFTTASGAPGTHSVSVDIVTNGCPFTPITFPVTICSPVALDNVTNNGGQLCAVTASNSGPVTVSWYTNSTLVSANSCIPAPTSNTTYDIVISNQCGCTDTFTYVYTGVGIIEATVMDIAVYPNPTSGKLSLRSSISMELVTVTGIGGKEVLRAYPQGTTCDIDLENLPNGIYLITIEDHAGGRVHKRITMAAGE